MSKPTCTDSGCEAKPVARGLCGRHYSKAYKAGTLPPLPPPKPYYLADLETGCWVWQRVLSDTGYGTRRIKGKTHLAHRLVYEQHRGPIPAGMTLDHLCRNRACVNPVHLEPVTPAENKLRGESPNARNARKTHCLRGHPFNNANTYLRPDNGKRQCRACAEERERRRVRNRATKTMP